MERSEVVVGELVGWRWWFPMRTTLRSLTTPSEWLPGEIMTGNPDLDGWQGRHVGQGIHAYTDWATAQQHCGLMHQASFVGGSVYLWGDVRVHSIGYRASHAAIREIDYIGHRVGSKLTAEEWTELYNVNQ